jgi:hypothetical protein
MSTVAELAGPSNVSGVHDQLPFEYVAAEYIGCAPES